MSQAQVFAGEQAVHISSMGCGWLPFEYRNERKLAVMEPFSFSSFLICWKGVGGVGRCGPVLG